MVLFLLTIPIGIGITALTTWTATAVRSSEGFARSSRQLLQQVLEPQDGKDMVKYLRYLEAVLTPPIATTDDENPPQGAYLASKFLPPAARYWDKKRVMGAFYELCLITLHHLVIPWMAWPRTLLYRYMYGRNGPGYTWNPFRAVRDTFIILLSPIPVFIFLVLTPLLVLMDLVARVWHRMFGNVPAPRASV